MNLQNFELSEKLYRFYDWFIPEKAASRNDQNDLRINRMVVVITTSAIFIWLVCFFFYTFIVEINSVATTVSLAALLGFTAILFFFKVTGACRTAVVLVIITVFITTFSMILATGGLKSPIMAWLLVTPLLTMMLLDFRSNIINVIFILALILTVNWLEIHNHLLIGSVGSETDLRINALINYIGVTLFLSFVGGFYKLSRVHSDNKLDETMTQLRLANEELRLANEKAKAGTRAKSAFLANMSHEIRTPLNSVIGMTNLLLDTPLTPEQLEFTQIARSSSDTLLSLINDILDFSKIEAGKLELEDQPFDLYLCLDEAVNMLVPQAIERNLGMSLDIAPDVPRIVQGDIVRLRQILINLLSNAVKFTQAGEIRLTVKEVAGAESHHHQLLFSVQDTGIGIPPEGVERLFQSFSQIDSSTTRHFGGTGLGLAISKQLVSLMGGEIWVESELGVGSNFQFIIQIQGIVEEEVIAQEPRKEPLFDQQMAEQHPLKILVAEDNRTNQKVVLTMLRRLGYHADVAKNGLEALEAVKQRPYDLVLMDVQMPQMDGVQATVAIHNSKEVEKRPYIIAVTANTLREDRDKCLQAGMDDYVRKPLRPSEFIAALKQCSTRADYSLSLKKR